MVVDRANQTQIMNEKQEQINPIKIKNKIQVGLEIRHYVILLRILIAACANASWMGWQRLGQALLFSSEIISYCWCRYCSAVYYLLSLFSFVSYIFAAQDILFLRQSVHIAMSRTILYRNIHRDFIIGGLLDKSKQSKIWK